MIVPPFKSFSPALAAAALLAAGANASAMDYFAGKTITVQAPSRPGGAYHAYCLTVQRNLPNYLPSKPTTVITNLPGSGGAKSAGYMYNVAPKNGTLIAMIAPGTITVPLVRKVKFNAREFEWLGSPAARSGGIWMWHTSGITTREQVKQKEVTIATSGFASAGSVFPRLVNATLGTKLKLIYGYGGGALNLSIERGETQGRFSYRSTFAAVRPTWLPEKKIIPIIALGPRDPDPVYNGVPHLQDLLKPGSLERKMYDVLGMNLEIGQAFYVPPGTNKAAVDALTVAFDKMLADPVFKDRLLKRRIEYSPKSAQVIRAKIKEGFDAATPDVVRELKKIFTKKKKA